MSFSLTMSGRPLPSTTNSGQEDFLTFYHFGRARAYLLIIDGKPYDSKAILGAAYRYATGAPLGPHDFSGGVHGAARVLRDLGFEIHNIRDRRI